LPWRAGNIAGIAELRTPDSVAHACSMELRF
jgi:hypothetical protein